MNTLVFLTVLGSAYFLPPRASPAQDAPQRYERECSGAAASSEKCQALARDVYEVALRSLIAMEALHLRIDKGLLREAMRSPLGALQAAALKGFRAQPLEQDDAPLVIDSLSSPFPGVRNVAFGLVGRTPGGERYAQWQKRAYAKAFGIGSRPFPYLADEVPKEAALGAPIYPGSTFVYFASGPQRAFFTSADPADKVVAFFAKGGKRSMTLAELESPRAKKQPDPMEIMRRMQSGEDPRKVMAEIQAEAMAGAAHPEWTKGIKGEEGVENPRFVEVAPASVSARGIGTPAKAVVVFDDSILGKTAIVYPRSPKAYTPGTDPSEMQQMIWEQQLLASPLPRPTAIDPTVR